MITRGNVAHCKVARGCVAVRFCRRGSVAAPTEKQFKHDTKDNYKIDVTTAFEVAL